MGDTYEYGVGGGRGSTPRRLLSCDSTWSFSYLFDLNAPLLYPLPPFFYLVSWLSKWTGRRSTSRFVGARGSWIHFLIWRFLMLFCALVMPGGITRQLILCIKFPSPISGRECEMPRAACAGIYRKFISCLYDHASGGAGILLI